VVLRGPAGHIDPTAPPWRRSRECDLLPASRPPALRSPSPERRVGQGVRTHTSNRRWVQGVSHHRMRPGRAEHTARTRPRRRLCSGVGREAPDAPARSQPDPGRGRPPFGRMRVVGAPLVYQFFVMRPFPWLHRARPADATPNGRIDRSPARGSQSAAGRPECLPQSPSMASSREGPLYHDPVITVHSGRSPC